MPKALLSCRRKTDESNFLVGRATG